MNRLFTDWDSLSNLLCIRLDNMGDVLMTTPALRALRKEGRRITLLTSASGAAIAPFLPEVDDVLSFDVPWIKHSRYAAASEVLRLAEVLRERRFDGAVLFTVQSQNPLPAAMLCYLAGIPKVLGYCRENPYDLITHWVPDEEVLFAAYHEVDRQLRLVAAIGCSAEKSNLSLRIPPEAKTWAAAFLQQQGLVQGMPWLVLHPGASEARRRYPAAQLAAIAAELVAHTGVRILLTGSASERELTAQLAESLGSAAIDLGGALPLEHLIALIDAAPVVLTNNSGPVHIAAATGTPVVVLYAMTNPQHTPWQVEQAVFYFEVPEDQRSRNVLLQTFPHPGEPRVTNSRVVRAVEHFLNRY
ncbi:MAG: glycosyltransferase family 9 protein [Siphonobacter aquaeclarae]|nr:glycosyltransferase family 9 protein [Siphonobacter aquaeclarae]